MENDNEQSPQLSNIQSQDSDGKYAITIHHHSNRLMQEQSITTHSALCLQPDLFVARMNVMYLDTRIIIEFTTVFYSWSEPTQLK